MIYIHICVFHLVPLLQDLYQYVTPEYTTHWREIGVLLGLPDSKMKIIQANNPNDVQRCCNEMLAEWLRVDLDASWEKLFAVIESPVVSGQQTIINQGVYLFGVNVSRCLFIIEALLIALVH